MGDVLADRDDTLDAECVRENEVQTEAQAEEEAAQEEQRMSMFTRDDEHPNPWLAGLLAKVSLKLLLEKTREKERERGRRRRRRRRRSIE